MFVGERTPAQLVDPAPSLQTSKTPGEIFSMSISAIDPKTALIVVDLQKGVVAHPCVHPVSVVIQNAAELVAAFHELRLPVVFVTVAGTAPGRTEQALSKGPRPADWAELVPELTPHPGDHHVTKRTWDAFTGTGLETTLKDQGVTQVVIAGIATSIGVESTARVAYALGFNVTLAVDAMSDRNAAAHDNSVSYIFPRLGETGTNREILSILTKRSA